MGSILLFYYSFYFRYFNQEFKKISDLTGLIITKLDTSAKGGILLAICKKYGLPIIAVGMGEKESDLHSFASGQFAKILVKN